MKVWKLARRALPIGERSLIMGVLNVTPDSFSDGGKFFLVEEAIAHAEQMASDGADIIDIGGESTRPGAGSVSAEEEIRRVVPVIERLSSSGITVSIDTTKSEVAKAALDAGAEIVNDISGLRFDFLIADAVAKVGAGLILMHSRGTPATMQKLPPVPDIMEELLKSLGRSAYVAQRRGVAPESIVLDPGIGFGKTAEQSVEIIAKLDQLVAAFPTYPILIGTSRKSFIGRILNDAPVEERLHGTMATITAAILKGAHIVRVHDVKAASETVRVADAIKQRMSQSSS